MFAVLVVALGWERLLSWCQLLTAVDPAVEWCQLLTTISAGLKSRELSLAEYGLEHWQNKTLHAGMTALLTRS
jgi:hypothetical protein